MSLCKYDFILPKLHHMLDSATYDVCDFFIRVNYCAVSIFSNEGVTEPTSAF